MSALLTLLIFLGTILVLVGVHEGGHFLAAKLSGVYVKEFAIGFGPRLFSIRRGETRYAIRIIPIGGYVSMAGEDRAEEDEEIPKDRFLYSKPPLTRIGISVAGPIMNLAMTLFVAIIGLWAFGLPLLQVGAVMPDMPAASVFQPGDRLLSVAGEPIYNTDALDRAIQASGGAPVEVTFKRHGTVERTSITPKYDASEGRYLIGIYPSAVTYMNTLLTLDSSSSFYSAGLRAGDRIVSVAGTSVSTGIGVVTTLDGELPADEVAVHAVRDGKEEAFTLRTAGLSSAQAIQGVTFSDLGIAYHRPGFAEGIVLGAGEFATYVRLIAGWFRGILTGQVSAAKSVAGPVGIAELLGTGAKEGGSVFLRLLAYLSLSFGILNLIPFPALDGSRAAFAVYEIVRGKPIPPEREGMIHLIGFAILLALMLLVTFNDISRLFR